MNHDANHSSPDNANDDPVTPASERDADDPAVRHQWRDYNEKTDMVLGSLPQVRAFAALLKPHDGWRPSVEHLGYTSWTREGCPIEVKATPDWDGAIGKVVVETMGDGVGVMTEEFTLGCGYVYSTMAERAAAYQEAMVPHLDKAKGLWEAEVNRVAKTKEFVITTNQQLHAFVDLLTPHNGWAPAAEHQGYLAWYNDRFEISINATPDWENQPGRVPVEVTGPNGVCISDAMEGPFVFDLNQGRTFTSLAERAAAYQAAMVPYFAQAEAWVEQHLKKSWSIEEVPYSTNDRDGGMYLHLDKRGECDVRAIYVSNAVATEARLRDAIDQHGIEAFAAIAEKAGEQAKLKEMLAGTTPRRMCITAYGGDSSGDQALSAVVNMTPAVLDLLRTSYPEAVVADLPEDDCDSRTDGERRSIRVQVPAGTISIDGAGPALSEVMEVASGEVSFLYRCADGEWGTEWVSLARVPGAMEATGTQPAASKAPERVEEDLSNPLAALRELRAAYLAMSEAARWPVDADALKVADRAIAREATAITERDRQVWKAAITLANNICVQMSDRARAEDGDTTLIATSAACAQRIREHVLIDEGISQELAELFRSAKA